MSASPSAPVAPRSTAAVVPPALVAALAAVLLTACGGAPAGPDFAVRGAGVVVSSTAAFTRRSDFPARVEKTVEAALRYWGGTWAGLEGTTITFDGRRNVACEGNPNAIGCYQARHIRVSTSDVGLAFRCVEETVLVHEIGHAVIGDPDHRDPRWMDFGPVARELEGSPGYEGDAAGGCHIVVNVWRHPPASQPAS